MSVGTLSVRGEIQYGAAIDFIAKLDALGDVDEITLYIGSDGGSVFDGVGIMSALNRHPAHKTVIIESLAASAAGYVALAGDEIHINEAAFLFCHNATSGCLGNKVDMRRQADVLDQIDDMISGVFAARTGGSKADWGAILDAETWFSGPEVAAMGLAKLIPNKRPAVGMTHTSAKAAKHIAKRPAHVAAMINRLSRVRPAARAVSWSVSSALEEYSKRAAKVQHDQLMEARAQNAETIVRNARSRQQAESYLRVS